MFLVRQGKVFWKYPIPLINATDAIHESDDATLRPAGNNFFARRSGAGIIAPGKINREISLSGGSLIALVPTYRGRLRFDGSQWKSGESIDN